MKKKTCHICGCTDDNACGPDGCSWFNDAGDFDPDDGAGPLALTCDACVMFLMNIVRKRDNFKAIAAALGCDDRLREIVEIQADLQGNASGSSGLIIPG